EGLPHPPSAPSPRAAGKRVSSNHDHELLLDARAAALLVEIDGAGPGDDGALVAEAAEVGEGCLKEHPAEAAAAMVHRHAHRTECAEAAVVRLVRGAGDDAAGVRERATRRR